MCVLLENDPGLTRYLKLVYYPSRIPSNTLCVTLDPPEQTFYLPSARSAFVVTPPSRSPSPSAGYNSDGESGVRKVTSSSSGAFTSEARSSEISPGSLEQRVSSRKGGKRTATWQDLVRYVAILLLLCRITEIVLLFLRLVDLQAVIKDTASSLSDVVREIDNLVTANDSTVLVSQLCYISPCHRSLRRSLS